MLKPSKKLALAVEAVVDIALHSGLDPVQSQDIAARLGLPRRYLEQVMQQLVREGILKGVRGPRGGYRLAREQRRISVGDVFRVVQGDEPAEEAGIASGSELGHRIMVPFWGELEEELMRRLDTVTVEDLCERAAAAGLRGEQAPPPDFII
ncbi:RrF2 family transcriptional regulator [Marinimicrococcus flavescens]|uniref:Rrf2 family transcriptional regulator n=1 Tax=Marinimicrococcus flavescens TaxID=3031815 RepID=A0AAP3UY43_9PROT|nr:Rrf2 family transcriptional regulator [Marinimicrococcus flavescens]